MADSLVHSLASSSQLEAFDSFEYAEELCTLGSEWIQEAGVLLNLTQNCVIVCLILFRRYCTLYPPRVPDLDAIVMACVSIGSKTTETPASVQDICNVVVYLKERFKDTNFEARGFIAHDLYSEEMYSSRNRLSNMELEVLRALNFDTHIVIPHKLAIHYLQTLQLIDNKKLLQITWNFLNDASRTRLCVLYPPFSLACGCIAMAARVIGMKLPKDWYRVFDTTKEEIDSLTSILENFYKTSAIAHKTLYLIFTEQVSA
ncbi:cyclin L family cyclin [Schizosaccharomyces pombe]|uniref:Uncharacterized cyclin-L1-like protein C1296.05c n=1 Tax=Schizosaccharomyces pombe (strain 972 / ATCC 24843) TaxID=284812 RepID=YFO5_SCHPO|nr:putative cyclin L family cyclin [Schizosaccharomyces pombe]O94612.1 RecName: Full=Uncharacterized cyclin-L1-like protein C1296.05c [Schizosaccharomyces pombe 972h-]CAB36511.1 cyclin L family cyclin (predicted) [Schizosaccharomyces pombe]|eukprot:NP_593045.1 putative cyclin L family cyclin [Schizosaccharomyces pombe]